MPTRLDVYRTNNHDIVANLPYVWKKNRKCRVCDAYPLYYMTFPATPGYPEGRRWVCACEDDYCPKV